LNQRGGRKRENEGERKFHHDLNKKNCSPLSLKSRLEKEETTGHRLTQVRKEEIKKGIPLVQGSKEEKDVVVPTSQKGSEEKKRRRTFSM